MKEYTSRWDRIAANLPEKNCVICGELFKLRSGVQKICPSCKTATTVCACGCGKTIPKYIWDKVQRQHVERTFVHGHNRNKELNPRWNGGIRYLQNGRYRALYVPEHPNAQFSGYVYEHRLVMEKKLGRYLAADEVVHHVNEDAHDNRPENLMVMSNSEHMRLHARLRKRDAKGKLA